MAIYMCCFFGLLVLIAGCGSSNKPVSAEERSPAKRHQNLANDREAGQWYILNITSDRTVYEVMEPIIITARLSNAWTGELPIVDQNPFVSYEFNVILPNGQPAPLTVYGRQVMSNQDGGRVIRKMLKPGAAAADVILLNRVFDFTSTGRYRITLSRHVWTPSGGRGLVTSDPLSIEID